MPRQNPEQRARKEIDAQLAACGWVVQNYKAVDFYAGRGIALREVPLTTGPYDYHLLVNRKARQEVLADDFDPTPADLDRSVVVPDQVCTILRAYRAVMQTELFPGLTLVPKALIFAKGDSHAEDIVHLCREVFGKGSDFFKKITYQAKHRATGKPAKSKELASDTVVARRPFRFRHRCEMSPSS